MALKIIKEEVYPYIPISERTDDKPFTVKIRRLTSVQMAKLQDRAMEVNTDSNDTQTISLLTGTQTILACKLGIVGWENMVDEAGNEVKPVIGKQGLTDKSLDMIPQDMQQEIQNVILGITSDPENINLHLLEFEDEVADKKVKTNAKPKQKATAKK